MSELIEEPKEIDVGDGLIHEGNTSPLEPEIFALLFRRRPAVSAVATTLFHSSKFLDIGTGQKDFHLSITTPRDIKPNSRPTKTLSNIYLHYTDGVPVLHNFRMRGKRIAYVRSWKKFNPQIMKMMNLAGLQTTTTIIEWMVLCKYFPSVVEEKLNYYKSALAALEGLAAVNFPQEIIFLVQEYFNDLVEENFARKLLGI